MTAEPERAVPYRRLTLAGTNPDADVVKMLEFGHELHRLGERPWFEVWYPNTTVDTFDAVEFFPDTGAIVTLRPYAELEGSW